MITKSGLIDISNKLDWSKLITRVSDYDFYTSYSYNSYYSHGNQRSKLYYFIHDKYLIIFPLIIRNIESTNYYDVTSVYGYAGPFASHNELPIEVLISFYTSLNNFFIESKIVSAFCRLHPSLKNEFILNGLGEIVQIGETVYIDLRNDIEYQKNQYKKGVKSDLSKIKRNGYYIIEDTNKFFISDFIEIYNENMNRVGASADYFFDNSYYNIIFNSPDINSKLYFVVKDNIKIATCIFIFTGNIIQYHLSGTRGEYLKNSPVRLIIDHVRIYGTENGYKELHLGGGVGSSEDSLFKFKAGFSDCRHQFKVWRHIVNPMVYNQLVQERYPDMNSNYFPLYRAPRESNK